MVPIKSLLRCKSVCKSWYTLITKPNFTTVHLNCNAALKKNIRIQGYQNCRASREEDGAGYVFNSVNVEIYNLSIDSWRGIDAVVPYVWYFPCSQLLFNGAFHWWAYDEEHGDEWALSFHINKEVFQQTWLPDVCAAPDGKERDFLVLNESIALLLFNSSEQTSFDVWLMTEYGVAESWTKHFTIGPLVHPSGLYCFGSMNCF
ncbi:hypothetical protein RJ639_041707 [Escallonia herrerae]|uniref:F-box protein n=1 Tax=Escallonia herrerae TaxID=1293975 RepID=A0AA88WEK6_9ASTE|nr:hypothetical protein RJ639_041707 [Escallonia herrerae]